MLFEVNRERTQCVAALKALFLKFGPECHEDHQPVLESVRKLIELFEAGRLPQMRPVFQMLNRRLNTPLSPAMREKHRALRQALVRFRLMADSFATQDPELSELIYVLNTVSRVFGISSVRTTRLTDGAAGTYIEFFCREVNAAADIILSSLTVPREPLRQSA
ncbi:MAG: hypothetical protein ACEQSB_05740 [Undibacterium sp.]